jgi:hypothetical protein
MVDVRWIWVFLDTVETEAGPSWEFWRQVTRSQLSPTRGERGEFATFLPDRGDPWVKVQAVQSGGEVHLDLDVDDPRAAADEAKALGASELGTLDDDTGTEGVVILASPAGQVFCFTRTASSGDSSAVAQHREGEPDLVDQVCLDLPEDGFAVDAVFWHELTGWDLGLGRPHEFTTLTRPNGIPVRLVLQRLDEATGTARAHVDLACRDRAATAAEHCRLGAEVVGEGAVWTVLRDPVGRTYCLTDRDPSTGRLPAAHPGTHHLESTS